MKIQPTKKSQEVLRALDLLFSGLKTTPIPQYQMGKIYLYGYQRSNCFVRLVP